MGLTMNNSMSLLLTFLEQTKRQKERLPQRNFATGGIGTSLIPFQLSQSLTPP